MKPRVLISCPNRNGWVNKLVTFKVMKMLQDPRFDCNFIMPTHSPFVNNLHLIRRDLLKGNWDFWLSIDDDNPPATGNPLDLVELDLDVVGCPTPVWHTAGPPGDRPWYFNAVVTRGDGWFPVQDTPEFAPGLIEVDAVGTGCILIARHVMEEIEAPFMREWTTDGVVEVGNDYAFCRRAKKLGYRIWAHFGYVCDHLVEVPLLEAIERFGVMKRG